MENSGFEVLAGIIAVFILISMLILAIYYMAKPSCSTTKPTMPVTKRENNESSISSFNSQNHPRYDSFDPGELARKACRKLYARKSPYGQYKLTYNISNDNVYYRCSEYDRDWSMSEVTY